MINAKNMDCRVIASIMENGRWIPSSWSSNGKVLNWIVKWGKTYVYVGC